MEKRIFTVMIFILAGISLSYSQTAHDSQYLFEEFQDATVFFKDNSKSQEKMNYDLISNHFCFIDKANEEILVISNPQNIRMIKIGNSNFILDRDAGIEVLPTKPVIHVQYKAKTRPEAAEGAYGMKSETTATTSYSGIYSATGHRVDLDARKIIAANRYNIYWVEVKGKMKRFITPKQFVKIYNNHSTELETYIKDNNIDFNNADQVTKLCVYADSL